MRRWILLFSILLLLIACGHRKGPTGGPRDTEAPIVTSIEPAPFSEIGTITVTFSKPIDRSTLLSGFQSYPPILRKQFIWKDQTTLEIRFLEEFDPDTNYTLVFTDAIQCTHGNPLDQDYIYVYRHGQLQESRLSGRIEHESARFADQPVNLTLWSGDSIRVYSKMIGESSFVLDYLNPEKYFVDAWTDCNGNGKYDYGIDEFARTEPTKTDDSPLLLRLAVQDTIPPRIVRPIVKSDNLVEVLFREPVGRIKGADIVSADSLRIPSKVITWTIHDERLSLLTEPRTAGKYRLQVLGAQDSRGNVCRSDSVFFESNVGADSLSPIFQTSWPRNGATVSSLQPEIRLLFSEVIPEGHLQVNLQAVERRETVPVQIIQTGSDVCVVKPETPLSNYTTYKLTIGTGTTDYVGNRILAPVEISFITIMPGSSR